MAKRASSNLPLFPVLDYESVDPRKAAPSNPHSADMLQHALATQGRHAGTSVGLYLEDGNTATIIVPVPPSVVFMKVSFYMQGAGTVAITSTNDSNGQTFLGVGDNSQVPAGLKLYQTSDYPFSGSIGSIGSPLKVRSSAAWTWTTETVTVTFTTNAIADGVIHSMCFEPLWIAADV